LAARRNQKPTAIFKNLLPLLQSELQSVLSSPLFVATARDGPFQAG
jgi:hypothetical protein